LICKLAPIDEVKEGQWYEFNLQIEDRVFSLMLQKKNNEYIAFKNFCPHQGRRMNYSLGQFLTTNEGNIVCPAHGAEFKPDSGLCVNGPCLGESLESVHIQLNEESIFAIIK
jgi:nitrite reductase/ring-hydroxylating ferredoxin subunit